MFGRGNSNALRGRITIFSGDSMRRNQAIMLLSGRWRGASRNRCSQTSESFLPVWSMEGLFTSRSKKLLSHLCVYRYKKKAKKSLKKNSKNVQSLPKIHRNRGNFLNINVDEGNSAALRSEAELNSSNGKKSSVGRNSSSSRRGVKLSPIRRKPKSKLEWAHEFRV